MRLFIDDLRHPPGRHWEVARSYCAVLWYFENIGTPTHISFDHDLGPDQPTGYDIAHKMVQMSLDGQLDITKIREINIHSANPVGAENIRKLFQSYFNFIRQESNAQTLPLLT